MQQQKLKVPWFFLGDLCMSSIAICLELRKSIYLLDTFDCQKLFDDSQIQHYHVITSLCVGGWPGPITPPCVNVGGLSFRFGTSGATRERKRQATIRTCHPYLLLGRGGPAGEYNRVIRGRRRRRGLSINGPCV